MKESGCVAAEGMKVESWCFWGARVGLCPSFLTSCTVGLLQRPDLDLNCLLCSAAPFPFHFRVKLCQNVLKHLKQFSVAMRRLSNQKTAKCVRKICVAVWEEMVMKIIFFLLLLLLRLSSTRFWFSSVILTPVLGELGKQREVCVGGVRARNVCVFCNIPYDEDRSDVEHMTEPSGSPAEEPVRSPGSQAFIYKNTETSADAGLQGDGLPETSK